MTYETFLLALTMWREARSEGPEGMLAVGSVILNRGGSLIDTIIQKNQFSSMTVLGDGQTVVWPKKADPIFPTAILQADGLLSKTLADNTGGATFYFNPMNATSNWFQENIVRGKSYEESARIGRHVFYRKCPSN